MAGSVTLVSPALAQEVVIFRRGPGGLREADRALERVLKRDRYRVLTRDSVLSAGEVLSGDVLLLGATLRVEGAVEGDLVAVDSDVFARPGGRFGGRVTIMAGGFYGSSLAELIERPIDASLYDYRVVRRDDGVYEITAPGGRPALRLLGLYGLLLPGYDRVNAVTIGWGVGFDWGGYGWLPRTDLRLRYRSARTDVDGELGLSWPVRRHRIELRGGRTVRSNDVWMNGDVENSLYSLGAAQDSRNYYEADFAEAELRLEPGQLPRWWLGLGVGWERARPLSNRDPFSLFSVRGGFRSNLQVEESDVASAMAQLGLQTWLGDRSVLAFELGVEHADREVYGDVSFTLWRGAVEAEIVTVARHSLVLLARAQAPGSEGAPAQRWRALGGWGSLPTLVPVERVGDHMWWVSATYRLPLRSRSDLVGRLVGWTQYAVGNAWVSGGRRAETHNLGFGLTLGPLAAGVFTDPAHDFEAVVIAGIDTRR